jgi:hypothetical protein
MFITRGGRDYLIDCFRNGYQPLMDVPMLVDVDNYFPDQYGSGTFDPSGLYDCSVPTSPVSDFGFDLDPVTDGVQSTAYFTPRDMIEVAGELYAITYRYGPNDIDDDLCKKAKSTIVKMDTVITGTTATSVTGHADMLNPTSPWYQGVQMWDTRASST